MVFILYWVVSCFGVPHCREEMVEINEYTLLHIAVPMGEKQKIVHYGYLSVKKYIISSNKPIHLKSICIPCLIIWRLKKMSYIVLS